MMNLVSREEHSVAGMAVAHLVAAFQKRSDLFRLIVNPRMRSLLSSSSYVRQDCGVRQRIPLCYHQKGCP
jgi:hypothetical protein